MTYIQELELSAMLTNIHLEISDDVGMKILSLCNCIGTMFKAESLSRLECDR